MRQSLLALVVFLTVVGSARPAVAQNASPAAGSPRFVFEHQGANQAAPPDQTSVRTRRAAGFLALIPAGLLSVLYLYRRRPYLVAWTATWVLLALMLYVTTVGADLTRDGQARLGGRFVGLARVLGIGGVTLLCLAAASFRRAWTIPRWLILGLAALALVLVGLVEVVGLSIALMVDYTILSLAYGLGGALYLGVARRMRMSGPVAISVGMLGVGATYAYTVTLVARGLSAVEGPNLTVFISVAWQGLIALGMHVMVFEDMSAELQAINMDLAQSQLDLQAAAVTDPLTGCYNRRFFDEVVERELERRRRHAIPLSLLFIDCDNLKAINDTRGHSVGDDVLRLIAELIRKHVRRSDYVFRWGGDEFLVLLSCDERQALGKARDIQDAFKAQPLVQQLPPDAGLSIGGVDVPAETRDILPLIREVDARMYAKKRRVN
jgi:diguanylate cyclase (GGDEF)-like protein